MKLFRYILLLLLPITLMAAPKRKTANLANSNYSALSFQSSSPVIVIDAGHGGLDYGTKEKGPYCVEKRVALETALLVRKYLDQLGYRVVMTRSSDVFIPLWRRVHTANKRNCSLFVSVHFNSSPTKSAHGIEVFYCDRPKLQKCSKSSKKLADGILKQVIFRTKAKSRGTKKGNFYVIRETKIPAVLVEGGFISNYKERCNLKKQQYLDKLARGIADGIDKYFKS